MMAGVEGEKNAFWFVFVSVLHNAARSPLNLSHVSESIPNF